MHPSRCFPSICEPEDYDELSQPRIKELCPLEWFRVNDGYRGKNKGPGYVSPRSEYDYIVGLTTTVSMEAQYESTLFWFVTLVCRICRICRLS